MYGKKLISVRVDGDDYDKIMTHIKEKNEKSLRWPGYTFAEIVEKAMKDYIKNNKL